MTDMTINADTTAIATLGSENFIVEAANREKVTKILNKIEATAIEAAEAFLSGDEELVKLHTAIGKKQAESLLPLINKDLVEFLSKSPSTEDKEKLKAEAPNLLEEAVTEFSDFFTHSKALPYIKLACSAKTIIQNIDKSNVLSSLFLKKLLSLTSEDIDALPLMLNKFNDLCDTFNTITNVFDTKVSLASDNLFELAGVINDPLSLVETDSLYSIV